MHMRKDEKSIALDIICRVTARRTAPGSHRSGTVQLSACAWIFPESSDRTPLMIFEVFRGVQSNLSFVRWFSEQQPAEEKVRIATLRISTLKDRLEAGGWYIWGYKECMVHSWCMASLCLDRTFDVLMRSLWPGSIRARGPKIQFSQWSLDPGFCEKQSLEIIISSKHH